MVIVVGYLMVSTWRFYSFKDINFRSRHPFRLVVPLGVIGASIWLFSRPALFIIAILYMSSGVLWRLQWIFHRKSSPPAPPMYNEASHTP
jgi:CDP-diacylglycerol---serine O-phosphatidyltransferase